MRNKVFSSFVLAGALLSSANAVDFKPFGHIGATFNKGFSNGNQAFDYSNGEYKNADYSGLTAQLGLDVGFGNLHIGAAGWGGYGFYGSPKNYEDGYTYAEARYTKKYGDLSDLYVKYDGEIQLAVGRFDTEFLQSDWIAGHTQGVAAKWDSKYFGIWVTWVNDYATYGYQPNRFGSEINSFDRYSSSFSHFNIGKNDLLAGGINVDLGFLKIDPFVHYWLGGYGYYNNDETNTNTHSMIQAGTKVALEFGDDASIKSITSGRILWQNILGVNNDDTFLFWADEEVRFKDMVKVGAGWYSVGKKNGIYTINDRSRFYGVTYLTPGTYSYFGQDASSWYVFAGFESEVINFDLLYANGDYNEFSAIVSWNVFKAKNNLALQIGGGYVSNGFQSKTAQQNNAVVFAKLSF
ncbi:hypothetical protein BKH42_05285 [Helicobacter sp. 13S00482-2]|uniref:hypothetical protein n=1 Tax=Helicobacter sp. 13S00482-2 TaxID=1476200 RepID=UPI000BA5B3F6|nr:hypothetical protein [Helicobacter sp. 13S00482-2]PAF53595.1 hypothetical protein BKH42_05285 [Helicobacter sp. 13S00482-2]